jgi:hypothetical protein
VVEIEGQGEEPMEKWQAAVNEFNVFETWVAPFGGLNRLNCGLNRLN